MTLSLLAVLTLSSGPVIPPGIEALLHRDSLVVDSLFLGDKQSAWPFRFVRTSSYGETWVQLDDPFGGSFFGPATMVAALGEEAVAFAETRESRSVLFLPRFLTLSALGLIVTGLVAGAALPFVWYRRRYWRERARRQVADAARHHLAEGREAERIRTAQDLHDGPVQDLHALRMRLAILARSANDGQREELAEATAEAHGVIAELRRVAEDLRPPALGPFGLAAALRAFALRFGRAHPEIEVALDLDDDGQVLQEPVRLALFRVAQEAMNNAVKHSRPSRIGVLLRLSPDEAILEIDDDGVGYVVPVDLSVPSEPGHYGLVGMAERAEAAGATLDVSSRIGEGTRVRACVPVSGSTVVG